MSYWCSIFLCLIDFFVRFETNLCRETLRWGQSWSCWNFPSFVDILSVLGSWNHHLSLWPQCPILTPKLPKLGKTKRWHSQPLRWVPPSEEYAEWFSWLHIFCMCLYSTRPANGAFSWSFPKNGDKKGRSNHDHDHFWVHLLVPNLPVLWILHQAPFLHRGKTHWHLSPDVASSPKGPKIEKLQDRPPGLKFSIEIEIFKQATTKPDFCEKFWRSGMKHFNLWALSECHCDATSDAKPVWKIVIVIVFGPSLMTKLSTAATCRIRGTTSWDHKFFHMYFVCFRQFCEPSSPTLLQHFQEKTNPKLSKNLSRWLFFRVSVRGNRKLSKICHKKKKKTIIFGQILTNFWRISGLGTLKNNCRDKFWTNSGFGVFLNAVWGKSVRKYS